MYLYFDRTGTLKEVVNDESFRQGDWDVNKIYIHVDGLTELPNYIGVYYRTPNGLLPYFEQEASLVPKKIPYNSKRDLKFFNYVDDFNCYEIPTEWESSGTQYSALEWEGNVALSVTLKFEETIKELGLIVFNVERNSQGNEIGPDYYLNLAQFQYLLSRINLNKDIFNANGNTKLEELPEDTPFFMSWNNLGKLYFGIVKNDGSNEYFDTRFVDLSNGEIFTGSFLRNESLSAVFTDSNKDSYALKSYSDTKFVAKTNYPSKLYGTSGSGQETTVNYGTSYDAGYVVQRDASGQIIVPLMPTENYHAVSRKYIDDLIESIKKNSFTKVDTTEYPTLQDFLDDYSNPEEGYIYLYPVNTSDLTKGYHQYIWEVDETTLIGDWTYIGDTQLDLTNYPTLSGNNTFTGDNSFVDVTVTGTVYTDKIGNSGSSLVVYSSDLSPSSSGKDLGKILSGGQIRGWRDVYITRYLSDATYNITVAQITKNILNAISSPSGTVILADGFNNYIVSADTTFNFEVVELGYAPEYRGTIRNGNIANSYNITFSGITHIKTNDDSIVINGNVVTLPASVSVEFNSVNGNLILYNWSVAE